MGLTMKAAYGGHAVGVVDEDLVVLFAKLSESWKRDAGLEGTNGVRLIEGVIDYMFDIVG